MNQGINEENSAETLRTLNNQIQEPIIEIERLFTQLQDFVNNFNSLITDRGIAVTVSSDGVFGVGNPTNFTDQEVYRYITRLNVIDSLINGHGHTIERLIDTIGDLEHQILRLDAEYVLKTNTYIERLTRLLDSYGH